MCIRSLFVRTAVALSLFSTFPALAQTTVIGTIAIESPWARPTAPGVPTGAVYLSIRNTAGEPDRLLSASSDVAKKVELHTHEMQDGLMKMVHLAQGVDIEGGELQEFVPGGKHIMLMGLAAPLVEGETITLQLEFERAGGAKITVPVGNPQD